MYSLGMEREDINADVSNASGSGGMHIEKDASGSGGIHIEKDVRDVLEHRMHPVGTHIEGRTRLCVGAPNP